MKKRTFILLCALTALLLLGAGLAWLFLSPAGVFQKNGPEEYMQSLLESSDAADWASRIAPNWDKPVSEFENRDELFSRSFAAAVDGEFSFREYEPRFRRSAPVYILSAGERDLCLIALRHEDGWQIERITVPEDLLAPETKGIDIAAPAGSEVYVNGILLREDFKTGDFVAYEDMPPLENRFESVPHRELWEVDGLYEVPEIRVLLHGEELPLQSRRGESYAYLPPDAGAYSFRFFAPGDASVIINGAELGEADAVGVQPLPLEVNLSEEQRGVVPEYHLFELHGLYSPPVITVTATDGRAIAPVEWAGETVYPAASAEAPEEELAVLVETYLTNYCHFGAHHYGYNMLLPYVVEQGELWHFHINAQASLQWIIGEQLDIHELRVTGWLPMGSDLCLCSAHVSCTTTTAYETKDLELDYQLLCVRTEKGWRVQDMAYQ